MASVFFHCWRCFGFRHPASWALMYAVAQSANVIAFAAATAAVEAAKAMTFADCATAYINAHEAGWRNAKHRQQWTNNLATSVSPVVGKLPVSAVDTGLVLKVLEPIWTRKPETASRVRGRMEAVLDWAKVRGYRTGENPARWRGHLDHLLPAKAKVRKVEHHAA